jgi:pentatricopeptide repeat protein
MVEIYEDVLRYDIDLYELRHVRRLARMTRSIFISCSRARPPRVETALRLLQVVADRRLSIPGSTAALETLMLNAPNHRTAYALFTAFATHTALAEEDTTRIFNAFLNLAPPDSSFVFPPVDLTLDLVRDLQSPNLLDDRKVITTLIARYGRLASLTRDVPKDLLRRRHQVLGQAITNLHLRIKLNPQIEIDIPLLNALMDAYNRTGAPEEAMLVWGELVSRRARLSVQEARKYYETSVVTALDVCAFSSGSRRADKIWAWGRRHGFVSTIKAWNGWIETLCRLGRFEEACEIIVGDLKEGRAAEDASQSVPRANVETIRTFAKFSWNIPGQRSGMLDRIKVAHPEFWAQVNDRRGERWIRDVQDGPSSEETAVRGTT